MSAANHQEANSSSDALPFRQGALDAAKIRAECPQFRILIIGKANAGKTTILRKVCNAKPDAKPVIYDAEGKEVIHEPRQERTKSRLFLLPKFLKRRKADSTDVLNPSTDPLDCSIDLLNPSTERGKHNIEYQLSYPGSNFIFHDSRGIESGSEDELKIVKKFIQEREKLDNLKDQLHVIWYCVPMDDQRPISGAEKAFFSFGTGRVPVVLIFTKFDALEDMCYGKLRGQGKSHEEASIQMLELANKTFQQEYLLRILKAEFPPKTYICLAGMDKEENQCSELSEKTADILDNNVLVNLFVSTQKNNLDLSIKRGIRDIWRHCRRIEDILILLVWFPNFWDSSVKKINSSYE